MKKENILLILCFLVQQYQLSAQNLTVKKIYYPGSSKVLYEYQILPNGIYHGYYKEYTYDGLLASNYTKKFGNTVKGIHYFQDGKTVRHEFNQDEKLFAHGIQRVNAISSNGQLYTQHVSNWEHGKLISAKTMWNPTDERFKYENGNVTRFKNVKGKFVICDKYSIDSNYLVTGYFREDGVTLNYSKGLLMKANLVDDSSKILYTRIAKDTLLRIFDINSEDSTKLFYYYFDTTKLKAFISYNDALGGVSLQYVGIETNNILKYDAVDGHGETYVLNQGRGEYAVAAKKLYMHPNYPDTSTGYLRYWEAKVNGNDDYFKFRKWFFNNGEIEQYMLYKKLNNGETEVLTYDGAGKLIDKIITY
jgi:hypothetical protein